MILKKSIFFLISPTDNDWYDTETDVSWHNIEAQPMHWLKIEEKQHANPPKTIDLIIIMIIIID